jgi:chorismate synthase
MTPMATVNRHVPAVRPGMVLVAAAVAALALCEAVIRAKETGR